MRDFFDHQDRARARTRWLILLFLAAILATVVGVYLATVLAIRLLDDGAGTPAPHPLWQPGLFLGVAGGTILLICLASLSKIAELREGGGIVARMLGGREVDFLTRDPDEQRLLNVVEEMAIASGVPVPRVFVLDSEDGINAFAAGLNPSDAVLAVTWGALETLNRDQLQGVIAHEFSHIAHGDMRLNVRLMGWVFGLLVLGLTGRVIVESLDAFRFSSGGKRDSGAGRFFLFVLVLGMSLWVIGFAGFFITRVLKGTVSRQREFLADATAVQYTRNPRGLVEALAKIADTGSTLIHVRAEEASHLYFANGLKVSRLAWTATHPPLEERIRRLDPDGLYVKRGAATAEEWEEPPEHPVERFTAGLEATVSQLLAPKPSPTVPPPTGPPQVARVPTDPDVWIAAAGTTTPRSLAAAAATLRALPQGLGDAARDPRQVRSLVAALLLDEDGEIRRRQLAYLDGTLPADVRHHVDRLAPLVEKVGPAYALPLVDLSLPTLRRLSPERYAGFRATTRKLAEEDGRTDLFELVLERILVRHLDRAHHPPPPSERPRHRSLRPLRDAATILLSALAFYGLGRSSQAALAFYEGTSELGEAGAKLTYQPDAALDLAAVGDALEKLAGAAPKLRRQLLRAAVRTVVYDGQAHVREAELLRAVADGLDCPVPPFLPGQMEGSSP